jgi:predicted RecB family nuclease
VNDPNVVQGALQAGKWNGRADVLRRVETPSRFGAWSYEVLDTKLTRETKGNTVLQISLYSDLLSEVQELEPQSAFVVTPGTNYTPEEYRIADVHTAGHSPNSANRKHQITRHYHLCRVDRGPGLSREVHDDDD